MNKFAINSALAAVIGLGSITLAPVRASAEDLEFNLGRNGPSVRLRDNSCDPDREDCDGPSFRDNRRDGDRRFNRRDAFDGPRFCTEARALDKAERMGIRRARIDSADRRYIDVRGRDRRGERVQVSFGRAPNCPVVG